MLWYLWLQSLDAVVGHQEDLERPQPHEGPGLDLRQLVPAQVQQPGAVGDAGRDQDQAPTPAVHQVGGLVAQAVAGTQLEGQHRVQEERHHIKHHAATQRHLLLRVMRESPPLSLKQQNYSYF